MLKLISWTFQTIFFTLLVLVLGNWVRFDGTTISDHVKSKMAFVLETDHDTKKEHARNGDPVTKRVTQQVKKITDRVSFGNSSPSKKEREELKELIKKF